MITFNSITDDYHWSQPSLIFEETIGNMGELIRFSWFRFWNIALLNTSLLSMLAGYVVFFLWAALVWILLLTKLLMFGTIVLLTGSFIWNTSSNISYWFGLFFVLVVFAFIGFRIEENKERERKQKQQSQKTKKKEE